MGEMIVSSGMEVSRTRTRTACREAGRLRQLHTRHTDFIEMRENDDSNLVVFGAVRAAYQRKKLSHDRGPQSVDA